MGLKCYSCGTDNPAGSLKCDKCGKVVFDFQLVAEDIFYNFQRSLRGPDPVRQDDISVDFIMPPPTGKQEPMWVAKFFTCGRLKSEDEELFREAILRLMEFKHPSVDTIAGTLTYEGAVVIFYEAPEGVSFETVMDNLGAKADQVSSLCRQLVGVATAFQKADIIHGNINPATLRLVDGKLRLGELGVINVVNMLETGPMPPKLGDPAFMSPQRMKKPYEPDFSWDRYAVAALCYRITAGEYCGSNRAKRTPLKAPSPLNIGKSKFFKKAFSPDPTKRFGSAEEIASTYKQWPTFDKTAKAVAIAVPLLILVLVSALVARAIMRNGGGGGVDDGGGGVDTTQSRVAFVRVNTNPADAEVYIEGSEYITAEEAFKMPAGAYDVVVSAPGYNTIKDRISVEPGQDISKSYKLIRRLFYDDFTDNGSGWKGSKGVNVSVDGGSLIVKGDGVASMKHKMEFGRFELRCKLHYDQPNPGSEAGIVFMDRGRNRYVQLMANSGKGCFLDRNTGAELQSLGKMTMPCRDTNDLDIDIKAMGEKFVVTINGETKVFASGVTNEQDEKGELGFKVFADAELDVDYLELLEIP